MVGIHDLPAADEVRLPPGRPDQRILPVCPMKSEPLVAGDEFLHIQAGGGGFGDPAKRDRAAIDRDLRLGLLHGRMRPDEKEAAMDAFYRGETHILVSTNVVEVGIDVPNATVMVVEHAERFGLSQLHQLRGRVGRGASASACVFLYSLGEHGRLSDTARERLRAMLETHDGFEIARRDLAIRGPGEFLGARQSGAALLRFADLDADADLLAWAQQLAPWMLDHHPDLARQHVQRWLGGKSDYLKA